MPSPEVSAANQGKVSSGNTDQTFVDMTEDFGGPEPLYEVVQDGNTWILSGTANAKIPGRVYLYIDSNGQYEILGAEAVRQRYMRDAQNGKGIEYLRKRLYDAGYLNKAEYDVKDSTALARAITGAASKVSTEAVMNFQDFGITITESFDTLFNKYVASGTGDGRSGSGLNITSKTQTDQEIDDYFFQMLGRRATPAEKTDYYNKVNKEEKAALVKQTSAGDKTTTVGEFLDADDYSRIKADVIKPAIKGTNLEGLTKNNGDRKSVV